ncbi:MAG: hypothetical protein EB072_22650, partial [Betaproteobacteria bacterium]|nr:hypothetical protein [Betaproteobacteria bacterium]
TLFGGAASMGRTAFGTGTITVEPSAKLWTDRSTLSNNLILQGNSKLLGTNGSGEIWNGNVALTGIANIETWYSISLNGIVSGSGGFNKIGGGTLTLSGNNTYSGGTTINGGILKMGTANSLGTAAITVNGGGTLDLNGNSLSQTQSLTLSGIGVGMPGGSSSTSNLGALINSSPSNLSTVAGPVTLRSPRDSSSTVINAGEGAAIGGVGNITLSGVVSGTTGEANGLEKRGTGVLTLTGANTYAGATTISAGTLAISSDSNLGASPSTANAASVVLNGGTLQATLGATGTTNSFGLSGNRGMTLGVSGGGFRIDPSVTLNYAGAVAGTGGLTKSGSGTL